MIPSLFYELVPTETVCHKNTKTCSFRQFSLTLRLFFDGCGATEMKRRFRLSENWTDRKRV